MRRIYLLFAFFLAVLSGRAQDIIVKTDKSEMKSKVLEISDDVIKYKKFDFQEGPTYTIKKADVFMIIYKNGKRETFAAKENPVNSTADEKTKPAGGNFFWQFVDKIDGKLPAPKEKTKRKSQDKAANETKETQTASVSGKKQTRIYGGFATYSGPDKDLGKAPKLGYEILNFKSNLLPKLNNVGIGFASNNLLDNHYVNSQKEYMEYLIGTKHYLSSYLLKEFDFNRNSLGLLIGPSINYTQGDYRMIKYGNVSAGTKTEVTTAHADFFTGGLHTGQYAQRYLRTNKKGENSFFVRFGLEQFIMVQGSTIGVVHISFGF